MDIIRVEKVNKIYGSGDLAVHALKDVNLTLEDGYFYAIIGKSGSGKSTLLHILGALDQPTSGNYYLDGENVVAKNDEEIALIRRRKIGFIFQAFNLLPEYTVRENIIMPVSLDGKSPEEDYFNEIIDQLGIADKLNYYPDELSGGQIQRVSIARALMAKPAIVLADEPTGNLDEASSDDVLKLLRNLRERFDQTIIMVTHDMDIASTADRIITIKDGEIEDMLDQAAFKEKIGASSLK